MTGGRLEYYGDIVLDLPLPTSVNGVWNMGRNGVYKSPHYKRWQAQASKAIYDELPGHKAIAGRYDLEIIIPDVTRCDADNVLKAASDILELCEVVSNDRLMRNLLVQRGAVPPERCRITVIEI